ncbi:MAG: plasmid pRiA4b ORF-3 family protein [Cytophagales bacterium]|nr:MAG: plasmid pRiA4b ORF-3 family protein [Cytophagales bacterium]
MNIYQLKIELKYIEPKITRTVLVQEDFTFSELADVLMCAFNWGGGHLWQFSFQSSGLIKGGRKALTYIAEAYDENGFETDEDQLEASELELNEILNSERKKIEFEYDFGDSWKHEITLQKVLEKDSSLDYPICIKGARNAPPEDCGSYYGYEKILEHYANPKKFKAEIKEFEEWFGGKYDSEYFNIDEVNEAIQENYN